MLRPRQNDLYYAGDGSRTARLSLSAGDHVVHHALGRVAVAGRATRTIGLSENFQNPKAAADCSRAYSFGPSDTKNDLITPSSMKQAKRLQRTLPSAPTTPESSSSTPSAFCNTEAICQASLFLASRQPRRIASVTYGELAASVCEERDHATLDALILGPRGHDGRVIDAVH